MFQMGKGLRTGVCKQWILENPLATAWNFFVFNSKSKSIKII